MAIRRLALGILTTLLLLPQGSQGSDFEFDTYELAYVSCTTKHFERLVGNQTRTEAEINTALDSTFRICRPLIVKIRQKYGDTMAVYLYVDTRSYLTYQYQLYK